MSARAERVRGWGLAAGAVCLGVTVLATACSDDASPTGPGVGQASASKSVVFASDASIASGEQTELRLEARDALGRRLGVGGATVSFHALGMQAEGASAGSIGSTVDAGDGTYRASFTGTIAGSAVSIGATIDGDTVTSERPTVRVTPGPADPGSADLTLSTGQLDVGAVAELRLVLRDAAGNRVGAGGAEVAFNATGGTSDGAIGETADGGDGSYAAPFTAAAVGTALTVTATVDGTPVADTDSLRVVAGPVSAAESELTISADTVTVGTVVQLLLRARDAEGRPLVGGGRTVTFSAASGPDLAEGAIETDSVDLGNGTYTADFRATKAGGAVTISATIDGEPVGGPLPSVAVNDVAPSPQTSVVSVDDDALVAGDSTTLTLTVFGPDSTAVTSGGLAVEFISESDVGTSAGDVGDVTDHADGSYTATFTARRAGGPVAISATMDGTPVQMLDSLGVPQLPAITVAPGAVSLDSSFVEVSDDELALGETSLLRLRTRDGFGNPLEQGGLDVALTATKDVEGGPAGDIGSVTDVGDGTYTAVYTATEEVTALIGARIDGEPITSADVPIIALCSVGVVSPAGSVVTVADTVLGSGVGTTVTLHARDAEGRCLRNTGLAVDFAFAGGTSTGMLTATADLGDGTYSATLTGVLAGTPSVVAATIDGAPVTTALPAVAVIPGDVSGVASELTVDRDRLDVGAQGRVELSTRDAAGNRIPTGGLDVAFSVDGGTSGGTLSSTTDNADGTYFARFTATEVGSPLTVGASIEGTPADSTPPTIEVVAGPVSVDSSVVSLDGVATGDTATIAVGDTITATLTARDAQGRALVGGGRTVEFTVTGGTSALLVESSPALDADDGTYTSRLAGEAVGTPVTIGATVDGVVVTSPLPVLVVE